VQSLYVRVPIAVALVLVQLVQTSSSRTQPASAHVTLIQVGSKLGDVQSAYTSMLVSALADGTAMTGGEAAGADVGTAEPDEDACGVLVSAGELECRAAIAARCCPG
jgi:hypothetical protein